MTLESILIVGSVFSVVLAVVGATLTQIRYSQHIIGLRDAHAIQGFEGDIPRSVIAHAARSYRRRQGMQTSVLDALARGDAELNEMTLVLLIKQLQSDEAIVRRLHDSLSQAKRDEEQRKSSEIPPGAVVAAR